jgi:deoxyribonuclease IV
MRIGAHMSAAGGVSTAFARGERAGCTAMQIFVKNANQWVGKPIPAEERARFAAERERTGITPVVAHASYLINLGSPKDELWDRSIAALVDELERCESLSLDGLVLHPGSHVGEGEAKGIRRIARGLAEAMRRTRGFRCRVLLETTAGAGSNLGWRFEQLAAIRERLRTPERAGTCIDTCHVFAAGYDLRTPAAARATLDEFDAVCGTATLGAIHLNDSLKPFDSRRDRHAHVGEGEIGRAGFATLLRDARLGDVPFLLETPKGEAMKEDVRNLELVRALAAGEDPPRRRPLPTDEWRKGTLRGQARLAREKLRAKERGQSG